MASGVARAELEVTADSKLPLLLPSIHSSTTTSTKLKHCLHSHLGSAAWALVSQQLSAACKNQRPASAREPHGYASSLRSAAQAARTTRSSRG